MLRRLHSFVEAVIQSPVFRRKLRFTAAEALRDHGFSPLLAREELSARYEDLDVWIDEAHVFGPLRGPEALPPLEARMVFYGAASAAMVLAPVAQAYAFARWARARRLTAVLSPHEVVLAPDEGKGGYSNTATSLRWAQPGARSEDRGPIQRRVIVARDEDDAALAWLALLFGWDGVLGRLLGYPECCVRAFAGRWERAFTEHQGDVAPLALTASGGGPFAWWTNNFGRYFGDELIAHFPCRYGCPESEALARQRLAALEVFEPERAAQLGARLAAPVLYSERQGVFLFRDARVDGETLRFTPEQVAATSQEGGLFAALTQAGEVQRGETPGEVTIGGATWPAWLVDFTGDTPSLPPPPSQGPPATIELRGDAP